MDDRLKVSATERDVAAGVGPDTPLVTIAWRAMRAEHQRRADERRRHDLETKRIAETFAGVAEETHLLRRIASRISSEINTNNPADQLQAVAARLSRMLAGLDIEIVDPEGVPFTAGLMELFENIAQQPDPEAREPRIAEVVAPAITHRGALLRMGKAVIAVPAGGNKPEANSSTEGAGE